MSERPDPDPIVYLSRQNGKRIAVCLSSFGKWLAGVVATVFGVGLISVFGLIWSSNENSKAALIELRALNEKVEQYELRNDEDHRDFETRLRAGEKRTDV